jgi:glyoxylase-like metal-dependent hydrolase (beta-lactamase superfamily II)
MSDASLAEPKESSFIYPLGNIPTPAELKLVRPGVFWIRMPIPYVLNHINVWLLEEEDGWTLVDTGVATEEVKALWRQILAEKLNGKPLKRLIVTHLHPDHVGLAGWFARKCNIDLCMSRTDFLMGRNLVLDTGREAPEAAVAFYHAAGFDEDSIATYKQRFGTFGRAVSRLPDTYRRLKEGDEMQIGGRTWRIVVGEGHAPEHVCLFCPEENLLISGDQVLPRISSNVGVHPPDIYGNPLEAWLQSCEKLRGLFPADTLVLPAHNEPFIGLNERLTQLIEGHEDGLARLHALIREPKRAIDVFPALFKRVITKDVFFMATGESIAHLHCLIGRKKATVTRDENGVDWYRAA